jgi:predicted ATPase
MGATAGNEGKPFLKRLLLKDYKSIASCSIAFSRFTVLVGPNGSGKSNILDSLRFVTDSLRNSLEYAILERGGINEVRRRSTGRGRPRHFGARLEMNLPLGRAAAFAFKIGARRTGAFSVQEEKCQVGLPLNGSEYRYYHVKSGKLVDASEKLQAAIEPDRLYLQATSAVSAFRPVYDALTRMGFYNLNPQSMRDLQDPDPSPVLRRDGGNLTSILRTFGKDSAKKRVEQFLEAVVPGIQGVEVKSLGPKETLEFRQMVPGDPDASRFSATNMSDGTLRALGVLVALFQGAQQGQKPVPFVGIEEPESALHPGAAHTLAEAIFEASQRTQVAVTTHSPDLLDNQEISSENILAVDLRGGQTIVGPVDDVARDAMRDRLYTPGELLRIRQIEPANSVLDPSRGQLSLFAPEDSA